MYEPERDRAWKNVAAAEREILLRDILRISEMALDCISDAILMTKQNESTVRAMYAKQAEEIREIHCRRMGEMQDLQREKMKGAHHGKV